MNERPPTGYNQLSSALAERVDQACDRLEKAWQSGQCPALESYLTDVPDSAATVLLRELIVVDAVYRERAGKPVQPADYRARFPNLNLDSDWLAAALAASPSPSTTLPCGPASVERPPPELDHFLDGCEGADRAALAAQLVATDPAYWDRVVACHPTHCVRREAVGEDAAAKLIKGPGQALASLPDNSVASRPAIPGLVLEKVLGSGGMGVVFKARQPALDRDVAVKFLRDPHVADAAHRERFKQEARAVARLQHPNLVQLYEFGNVPGADGAGSQPYLVLEYVSGGSLADRLRGTRLPPTSAARLVESLAEAIHYAHQQGVIHRDLKPANILLQKDEGRRMKDEKAQSESSFILHPSSFIPKITDFGLAKFLAGASLTVTGEFMGTPSYMAPEQTTGKSADITPAVDVYGLGAILYEALSGRPPFAGETRAATVRQVQEDEPAPPRRLEKLVPSDLETICLSSPLLPPINAHF